MRMKGKLGKIQYIWNCSKFFAKLTMLIEKDSGNIFCKFHCIHCLNLNYIESEQVIKL